MHRTHRKPVNLTASAPIHDHENGRRRAPTHPMRFWITLLLAAPPLLSQSAIKPDPLGRDNPRSSVTNFLEACQDRDYAKAAQYLDLSSVPQSLRAQRGPELARQLDAVLNTDPHFSVFRLSRDQQGGLSDDSAAARITIATAMEGVKPAPIDLARVAPAPGATPVWLFSAETVFEAPKLTVSSATSAIERRLPPFLSTIQILETPLWKWIALLLGALLLTAISRQFDRPDRSCGPRRRGQASLRWPRRLGSSNARTGAGFHLFAAFPRGAGSHRPFGDYASICRQIRRSAAGMVDRLVLHSPCRAYVCPRRRSHG